MPRVGRVVALGYAAVKGTRHAARDGLDLTRDGVAGDRRRCLVDVTTARVLRTVDHPRLVGLVADDGDPDRPDRLRLTAPDGTVADAVPEPTGEHLTADYWGRRVDLVLLAGPHARLASAWLGRDVALAEAPPGAVVYGGGASLVTTASAAAAGADPARLRMNVLVEAGAEPFGEDAWVGRSVRLGGAVVAPTARTPRCAVVDRDAATGERVGHTLRRLAGLPGRGTDAGPVLGVDGPVVEPGRVRVGDPVLLGPF